MNVAFYISEFVCMCVCTLLWFETFAFILYKVVESMWIFLN